MCMNNLSKNMSLNLTTISGQSTRYCNQPCRDSPYLQSSKFNHLGEEEPRSRLCNKISFSYNFVAKNIATGPQIHALIFLGTWREGWPYFRLHFIMCAHEIKFQTIECVRESNKQVLKGWPRKTFTNGSQSPFSSWLLEMEITPRKPWKHP